MSENGDTPKEIKVHKLFGTLPLEDQVQSPVVKLMRVISKFIDGPTTWFRESVVEKFRGPPYPYYHRKFNRVPTIDECYTDDMGCLYEANEQYKRDRKVDFEIIKILKQRYFRCSYFERIVNDFEYDFDKICVKEKEDWKKAELNLFIKYGELGPYSTVVAAFMKQKHRLIWERRQKEKQEKVQ
ncbi:hypothetical protein RDWZM_008074 [Blomia tropicalis]|uniref:NADH dehydrogenase [ubiquinone] 1 beta subcomplex subunit 10 n=1 Tax=Blomia tropicalis TaxID=40697 RepID=A0A9Q0M3Q1_BLOTA|nr:hypothetical protein RDWZM_008074 [Blomia tropicalis]